MTWTSTARNRSLCFPLVPRFCGQMFLEAHDKELALKCVQAYNDWMVEEWCGGSGGRLIPLCLIPLWDVPISPPRRSGATRPGVVGRWRSARCAQLPRPSVAARTRTIGGTRSWPRATRPAPRCACTSDPDRSCSPPVSTRHVRGAHLLDPRLRRVLTRRLAALGNAGPLPLPQDRLLGEPGGLDAVHPRSESITCSRTAATGPSSTPVVSEGCRAPTCPAGAYWCFFDDQVAIGEPRADRGRAAGVRDRLPAPGLNLAQQRQEGRGDRLPGRAPTSSSASSGPTPSRCCGWIRRRCSRSTARLSPRPLPWEPGRSRERWPWSPGRSPASGEASPTSWLRTAPMSPSTTGPGSGGSRGPWCTTPRAGGGVRPHGSRPTYRTGPTSPGCSTPCTPASVGSTSWWPMPPVSSSSPRTIVDVTEDEFDTVFDTNVRGAFFCMQEAAKRIAPGGRIIAISATGPVRPQATEEPSTTPARRPSSTS